MVAIGVNGVAQAKARIFQNGRSQAVRIPAEYRFGVSEVFIRRDEEKGEIILSEHPLRPSLTEIFAELDAAGGAQDLFLDRDAAPPQERDWM